MEAAGFHVNQKVLDLYEANIEDMSYEEFSESSGSSQTLTRELPISYYNNMITKTYGAYNDAAIITFSRSGAEGLDHIAHTDSHVLQLTEDEKALVKHVKANFDKVIVLINTGNNLEIDELAQPKTADNLGVDAILYVGHVGNDGAYAIGEILNGTVNPSGHTVDLWSADFTKDPSYTNFGDMGQNGEGYDNYIYNGNEKTDYHSVEYREDIYVGYRYYVTVAADMNAAEPGSGDEWYDENVVYPFGYGLSYTTFEWKLAEDTVKDATIPAANSTVNIKVEVTNTGAVAGKDVVEVYATTPYEKGGIEKASRVLVGYAKTDLLEPGESQTVAIQFVAQDMASFDWDDKNNNGFYGYELEAGDYIISVCSDSHTEVASVTRTIAQDIACETDIDTGNPITAVFSQTEGPYAKYNTTNESLLNNLISREDGLTQPAPATKADRTVNQAWVDMMEGYDTYSPVDDDEQNSLWNVNSVPSTWKQATSHNADYSDVALKIGDMSEEEQDSLFRMISMGALKYFIIKVDPKKTMLFDPKESIDFNGNTGPFIQYTHARIKSILRKAAERGIAFGTASVDEHTPLSAKEIRLIKLLDMYPGKIAEGGQAHSPAVIANYAYDLAKEFNQYYHDTPILKEEDAALLKYRLMLLSAIAGVLVKATDILGIRLPERM